MATILVRFDVKDYDQWWSRFEGRSELRIEHGWRGGQLYSVQGKEGKVIMLMDRESVDAANEFFDSNESRRALQDAGVKRKPDLTPLEHVEDFDGSPPEEDEDAEDADEDDTDESVDAESEDE